jgi:AcrR family transcriptional regulator
MNKKTIKKHRSMRYFIDAAAKIMDEEGIEFVTIRKVSDLAGYNSATLYNYFKSVDELILYASVSHLREYTLDLAEYLKGVNGSIESYYRIWECFLKHSFLHPEIYNVIFFGKHSDSLSNIIEEYYSIFPEELGSQSEDLRPMLLRTNLYERNLALLSRIRNEGYLRDEDLGDVNEMSVLLYRGMMTKIINDVNDSSAESAASTLRYIKQTLRSFMVNEK